MGALDRDRLDRRSTTAHYAHCPIDVDGARHARVRQLTRRKRLRRLASERPVERWLLLASQRIEVEALIRDSTLNPTAFRWSVRHSETTSGAQITRLEYGSARSPAFFQFDRYRHQHYAVYSWDGPEQREEHFTGPWSQHALHVARWLAHLGEHERRRLSLEPDPGRQLRTAMVATQRWARSSVDFVVTYPLRRGAWYPVLSAGPDEVVLDVRHHAVIVPWSVLELSDTRPSRWSLVLRDGTLGGPYLVCPDCAARMSLQVGLDRVPCDRCHGVYEVESSVQAE